MSRRIDRFKEQLARALDDNLHTRQWHNIVDWLIIAMILISTAEIFLSTLDLAPEVRRILWIVDIVCLVFFLIEVTARIWVAPLVDPKYSGWKGRLKYCFSFHGFVDVISTYPFFLGFFLPLPFQTLRLLRLTRVMRVMRLSRYSRGFSLFTNAMREKRHELLVSLQFLVIITIILSFLLYFFEHDAQPEVYDSGFASVMWSFAQYIGDPGGFADTPPVTFWGRAIACIVGLLGIAIVAVPAGIIGAGFTDALEQDRHKVDIKDNLAKIHAVFERKLDRPTGYQIVLPFRTVIDIQARMNLTQPDIVEAVGTDLSLRLINLASTIPMRLNPVDRLAVELVHINRSYGCCIDRGASVTIISPSGVIDPCTSIFFYYVAMIGGFNWISREVGDRAPYRSWYVMPPGEKEPELMEYIADLTRLLDRPDAWGVICNISSGALEPEYDTQIHVSLGGPKGDTELKEHPLVADLTTFSRFYDMLSAEMLAKFGYHTDLQKYHNGSPNLLVRKIPLCRPADFMVLRIEWHATLWAETRMVFARELARVISLTLAGKEPQEVAQMKIKDIGFSGYPA